MNNMYVLTKLPFYHQQARTYNTIFVKNFKEQLVLTRIDLQIKTRLNIFQCSGNSSFHPFRTLLSNTDTKVLYRASADRRGFLIMSLSCYISGPTLSLHYTTINNIMYAVKTDNSPCRDSYVIPNKTVHPSSVTLPITMLFL